MILDKDEDDSTKEMFRKVAHAEKYLKLVIDGNEINNFPQLRHHTKEEVVDAWLSGNQLNDVELIRNQFDFESENGESEAVKVIKVMRLDQLKPYHAELVRRVEVQNVRRQFDSNGKVTDFNLNL